MKLNIQLQINDKIEVELTEYGYSVLNNWFDELLKDSPPGKADLSVQKYLFLSNHEIPNPVSRRKFHFQLWEFMNIFGPEMYNGNTNQCFVDNIIHLDTDTSGKLADFIL